MKDFSFSTTSGSTVAKGGLPSLFEVLSFRRLSQGVPLAVLTLGVGWMLFFNELRGEWQVNAQYSYGYVVPLLGIALLCRCWPDRPSPLPCRRTRLVLAVSAGLLSLTLPLRVVLEANPEWRLLYWIHGFQMLGLSTCLLYYLGGWPWVKYFTAPVAFMLIAVPWPMQWEQAVIQGLMRFVAGLTVGVADWLGIPALQHGNLVDVQSGVVGIDEACSGVRSLQSALMLSLFLGEMYRFSLARRLSLLGGSLVFVLVANLARTTFLVWAAANRGFNQMEAWHDTAGNLVMFTVLPSLLLLAYLLKPKDSGLLSTRPSAGSQVLRAMPRWVGVGLLLWLGLAEVFTEVWYRTHESHLVSNARWSVVWPEQSPQFKKSTVPERSLAILRCSDSEAASWVDANGNQWSGFFLHWAPGKNSAQLAKGHRPDICFPAAGAHLVNDLGQVVLSANGLELPFRHQTFEDGTGSFDVFYCLWSDRNLQGEKRLVEDGSQASRLQAVLAGKRNLGQQVFEIVLHGAASSDQAVTVFKSQLPGLIRREQAGS